MYTYNYGFSHLVNIHKMSRGVIKKRKIYKVIVKKNIYTYKNGFSYLVNIHVDI